MPGGAGLPVTPQTAPVYFDPPPRPRAPLWRRGGFFALIAGLHVVALLVAFSVVNRQDEAPPPKPLTVRMVEMPPPQVEPPRPKVEPPKPAPPVPQPHKVVQAPPPPVLAAAPSAPAAPSFAVAPQPEPRPVEAPPAPPAPIVAARFDADYLHNPKPEYPAMSTRLNEQGTVELRVRVSTQGLPLSVEIAKSSSYPRLDRAARAAVEKYRFVPAKQGGEPIESFTLVPITFKLD